ncbi:MAG: HAMP domain-containing histidine kinase [Oligoflexales bacterium]|nr:HAMP domain-containing histidine kinase [Oligoflexales bacterium]
MVTVTLKDFDLKYLEHYSHRGYRDVSIAEYARLISSLLKHGANYIVISWIHGQKDIPYERYQPLLEVLKNKPKDRKIVFAVQPFVKDYIPKELGVYAEVMEADPCQRGIQTVCIYQSHWEDWIIQEIVRDVWQAKSEQREKQVISQNLPRIFPSYLLYFNNVYEFQDFSYTELNDIWFPEAYFKDKKIFLGNGLIQSRLGDNVALGRVGTTLTRKDKDPPSIVGTPYHKYWAQIAQLFIDDALITVIPSWLSFSIAIIFAIFITLCLAYLGGPASLAAYLCIAILAPLFNALLIRFFHLYIPIFDTIFAGLSTFIIVTFAKLSLESFRHWQLHIRQKENEEIADIKGNFISLVSHNLNTPVAKMQGILDILLRLPMNKLVGLDLDRASRLVARIQLSIRAVLVATAIEDGKLNHEPMNIDAIMREFKSLMFSPLKRLGFSINMSLDSQLEELSQIPLRFDKRSLVGTIGSLIVLLFPHDDRPVTVSLSLRIDEDEQSRDTSEILVCELSCLDNWFSPIISSYLKGKGQQEASHRLLLGATLLEDVSANLVMQVMYTYQGTIQLHENLDENGGKILLKLKPKSK